MFQTSYCLNFEIFFLIVCANLLKSVIPVNSNLVLIGGSVLPIPNGMSSSLLESITTGEFVALEHCQEAFKWDRWNCPKSSFSRHLKQSPNRETAFTKAIIAAGIVHTITKNCSRGEIKECGCDPNIGGPQLLPIDLSDEKYFSDKAVLMREKLRKYYVNKNEGNQTIEWTWGGCSDDASFAMRVGKQILNSSDKSLDAAAYVGRHNFNVGREVIRHTMIKRCRCHGVSGSCSLQTCWMQVAPFKTVARKLREKYNRATRVTLAAVESSIALDNSVKQDFRKREIPVPENSLVYLEQSPDYCFGNDTEEWPGTKGRTCSRTHSDLATISERKSCRNLCRQCGHKVRRQKRKITKRCNCNFVWCCSVKCDTCIETVEEFYCD